MTAFLVEPLEFTVLGNSNDHVSAQNLNNDIASLIWQTSAGTRQLFLDLGANHSGFDTVALIGHNLEPDDSFRIIVSDVSDFSTQDTLYNDVPYLGEKQPFNNSAFKSEAIINKRYVRIFIQSINNSDGVISAQRIVIGKSVSEKGVDSDVELTFEDRSVIQDEQNYTYVEEYAVLDNWTFKLSQIAEDNWYNIWIPFLRKVGNKKGVLFVADYESQRQADICFGRIITAAKANHRTHNNWSLELTIRSFI